jgi:hypothetical protein
MNRGHERNIPRASFLLPQFSRSHGFLPMEQPRAYVAEKWSLTNRIRRHFARIKAARSHRY